MGKLCKNCGREFAPAHARGRTAVHCSAACRSAWADARKSERAHEAARVPKRECMHPACSNMVGFHRSKFCSRNCSVMFKRQMQSPYGFGDRCAIWIDPCPWCGSLVTRNFRSRPILCADCKVESKRRINAKKNLQRRASGELLVGVRDLALRDGDRCHLCSKRIDMALPGTDRDGPTIDHLIPVSHGGSNDSLNLALAHRKCNMARGNRGPAQLRLVA